ncbi:MAG TPA: DJ-1/PfpI family protein [Steroidobacteraceae bacterium]|nr:DJ-1/PfpI family protein [Steroidobacteraceae bacterium]
MTKLVHLYVFDGLSDWEPGFAIAGINNRELRRPSADFSVRVVAERPAPVVTAGGLKIQPDSMLAALKPDHSAMLILPGGTAWDRNENVAAAEKAREFLNAGVAVAAICGATAGLARAGVLDTREHTSNAPEYLKATRYAGAHLYRDEPAVTDDNLITASAMAPLEFAREIFAKLQIYSPAVLEAWYRLFATRQPECFGALMAAAARQGGASTQESRQLRH